MKIVRNWSSLVLSMLVTTVSSFLCFAILGNKMSVDDYGLFNSMIALASFVAAFVNNILTGIVINREIALKPQLSRNLLQKFLLVRGIAFVVGVVAMFIYTLRDEQVTDLVFAGLFVMLFFDSFWELFEQVAFGLKVTHHSMILNIVSSLLWLLVVLIVPQKMASVGVILILYAIILGAKTGVYGIVGYKLTKPYAGETESLPLRYLLFNSLPYLYNRILGVVTTQLPILLLDGYSGLAETAYYSVGEKFTTPVTKLATVTISAVFPFLTKALKKDRELTGKVIVYLFQMMLSCGACICLLLCATSDLWLVGLLGEKYSNAVEAFNYQIWYAVVLAVDCFYSMVLSSDFKQKTLSVVTTIDAFSLIPFLYFGIFYGAKGVALAKLICAIACLFYHLLITSKYFGGKLFNGRLLFSWLLFVVFACACTQIFSRMILLGLFAAATVLAVVLNGPTVKQLVQLVKNRPNVPAESERES